jgi:hypothetical protein
MNHHITEKQLQEILSGKTVSFGIYAIRKINAPKTFIEGVEYTIYLTEEDVSNLSTYGYFSNKELSITVLVDFSIPRRYYDISQVYSPYVPGVFA